MRRTITTKPRKLTRHEVTVARVAQLIEARVVLVASNVLDREETSVGPYTEAVDRGYRFACIGDKGRAPERRTYRAQDAADAFVERVGTTRANDAAKAAAKKHGIALAV